MLASLNSMRVFAEFWVVHVHVAPIHWVPHLFVRDLMSFFFVLSGFVMAHAHRCDDFSSWAAKRAFWWRRWSKTYPVFLFFWILCLVYRNAVSRLEVTPCYMAQLLVLDSWIGCEIHILNMPSWYISTLYWAWLVFPWLQTVVRHVTSAWAWGLMVSVWLVSVGLNTGLLPLGYWWYYPFPPLRILEFAIGCLTATTLETRLHWLAPAIAVFTVLGVYAAMYGWSIGQEGPCTHPLFSVGVFNSYSCAIVLLEMFVTKTTMVWAVLVHYLASSEHLHRPHWLSDVLQNSHVPAMLSTFSLELYLGHIFVCDVVHDVTKIANAPIGLHLVFIIVYGMCYLFHVRVQPRLNYVVKALGNCVASPVETV